MASGLRSVERKPTLLDKIDSALFAFAGLSTLWLAYLVAREGARPGWPLLLLVVFWVLVAYLLLPRLHRILTNLYVPGYFIGRTRTSDGLLGDPVNLALRGQENQIHQAMVDAGWTRADDLTLSSGRRIVTSTLRRHSYTSAPVSPLLLFDRQQDFAFQQETARGPSKRHHVRFWRCPEGWMLPGGYAVDWLAAGTYDRSVGLSLFTLQITHKIEQDTDTERDFITASLVDADPAITTTVIRNFSSGYHARNGGGDLIETDGDLPVVDVRRVRTDLADDAVPTDSRDRRPAQTVFGAAVAMLRSLVWLGFAVGLLAQPTVLDLELRAPGLRSATDLTTLRYTLAMLSSLSAVIDLGLGLAVLAGRNWARLLLMGFCVVTTIASFLGNVGGADAVTLVHLPSVGGSILVLLALSSHPARRYSARRPQRVRRAVGPS